MRTGAERIVAGSYAPYTAGSRTHERGYTMPRINKVAHVVLAVADVARAKAFYRDVLGMEVTSDRPEHGPAAFLSFGTQHHDIALFQAPAGAQRGALGLVHVALQIDGGLDELRAMRQHVIDAGCAIETQVTHGITNSIYFRDPDGNLIETYSEAFATGEEGIAYMRAQQGRGVAEPLAL